MVCVFEKISGSLGSPLIIYNYLFKYIMLTEKFIASINNN